MNFTNPSTDCALTVCTSLDLFFDKQNMRRIFWRFWSFCQHSLSQKGLNRHSLGVPMIFVQDCLFTFFDARYSIPLADWYEKEIKSPMVRCASSCLCGLLFKWIPVDAHLCLRKKSLRFPWTACSTTSNIGPIKEGQ